ncbi:MAG TPA: hypothetical protein VFU88_11355 [Ktedonobacterales bacterium]|nr:hypothetical protein [Ktedonobacterales bacterium]
MSTYTLVLFGHIAGAFLLVGALTVQTAGTFVLRRATRVEQVRTTSTLMATVVPLFAISLLMIPAAGLYMAFTAWGFQTAWLDVALVTFALLVPIGPGINGRHLAAVKRVAEAAPDGPLTPELAALVRRPLPAVMHVTFVMLTFGILFLMTNKPPLPVAIATILVAVAIGLASALPLRRVRATTMPATASRSARAAS